MSVDATVGVLIWLFFSSFSFFRGRVRGDGRSDNELVGCSGLRAACVGKEQLSCKPNQGAWPGRSFFIPRQRQSITWGRLAGPELCVWQEEDPRLVGLAGRHGLCEPLSAPHVYY